MLNNTRRQSLSDMRRGNRVKRIASLGLLYRFIPRPIQGRPRAVIFIEDPELINLCNKMMGIRCQVKLKKKRKQ